MRQRRPRALIVLLLLAACGPSTDEEAIADLVPADAGIVIRVASYNNLRAYEGDLRDFGLAAPPLQSWMDPDGPLLMGIRRSGTLFGIVRMRRKGDAHGGGGVASKSSGMFAGSVEGFRYPDTGSALAARLPKGQLSFAADGPWILEHYSELIEEAQRKLLHLAGEARAGAVKRLRGALDSVALIEGSFREEDGAYYVEIHATPRAGTPMAVEAGRTRGLKYLAQYALPDAVMTALLTLDASVAGPLISLPIFGRDDEWLLCLDGAGCIVGGVRTTQPRTYRKLLSDQIKRLVREKRDTGLVVTRSRRKEHGFDVRRIRFHADIDPSDLEVARPNTKLIAEVLSSLLADGLYLDLAVKDDLMIAIFDITGQRVSEVLQGKHRLPSLAHKGDDLRYYVRVDAGYMASIGKLTGGSGIGTAYISATGKGFRGVCRIPAGAYR